ncbi:MAG: EamA family transporter RarD [Thermoguttaceae bacterium]|nr:EamA family transporter RarD [Thermoguttaceae bacterium]
MSTVSRSAVESAEEPSRPNGTPSEEARGIALAFAAFLIWGLFPIYFDLLRDVPPLVTLAFRAVFTSVLLLPLVLWRGKGPAILATLRRPKYVVGLSITMAATAASWGLFIWLISVERTLYASLGNYVSPLANVVFGAIFLRERARFLSGVAIFLAFVGVAAFALGVGRLPWESVVVAAVFPIYSILRKAMDVDSTTALTIETLFSFPIAAAYIVYAGYSGGGSRPAWATDPYSLSLLVGAGALTAIPLLLFGSAARRAKLSTLGLLQYLTPTGQFLCGALLFREPTTAYQWVSFAFVWVALALFSVDLCRAEKTNAENARL